MFQIIILGDIPAALEENAAVLLAQGFQLHHYRHIGDVNEVAKRLPPDLVLLSVDAENLNESGRSVRQIKRKLKKPVLLLVTMELLALLKTDSEVADFIIMPTAIDEILFRMRRQIQPQKTADPPELTRYGALSINTATCEVCLQDLPVALTFKEYEMLKYLASNRNRVITREALLDAVWGYDYFGGDRTVDVHIRRLRSKIEDGSHTFIDTVRNIGYRFNPRRLNS